VEVQLLSPTPPGWFGVSDNPTVAIQRDTVSAQVITSDWQGVSFHAIDYIQIVPPFVPPFTVKHQFSKFNCF
jgi:beta-glucanase (GH16 family)